MINEIRSKIKSKKASCVEVTKEYLERAEKLNPKLNAYISITKDIALKEAKRLDQEVDSSHDLDRLLQTKLLLGVPVGLKDIYSTEGIETTAASNILKGYIPQYSATVVRRLEDAGAIIIGKLNNDAFAHGASGENSDFGVTKNPFDEKRVAGGSSSGAGTSVAAEMSVIGMGTDTGGSVRNPASFTNTVGLKPTYGRVSRYGIIAMASSLDSIGHITTSVEDSAVVLKVTAGYDPYDATSSQSAVLDYEKSLTDSISGLKIGIPEEFMSSAIDAEIADAVNKSLKIYEKLGAEIVPIKLKHTEYALAVYYILMPSEVSSNLARFDGIRFGKNRSEFGDEAKRRIMIGTYTLSSGYYDAYYLKAQKVRTLIIEDYKKAFEKVDVIVGPVSSVLPPLIGENVNDPLKMYLMDILTVPANLAGLPALAIPAGFSKSGLPIGLQIIGKHFDEAKLFNVGYALEQELK